MTLLNQILLATCLATPCLGAPVFFDDFENGKTAGWTITAPAGTSVKASADAAREGKYGLALTDDSDKQSASAGRVFAPQSGVVALDLAVRMSNATAPNFFAIQLKSGLSLTGPRIRFHGDNVQYSNGASWVNAQKFKPGEWLRISIVADTAKKTYDLFIDDVRRASAAAFVSKDAASLDRLSLATTMFNHAPTGALHVDNVMLVKQQ